MRVVGHGAGLRVENRVLGADVNPYLALAAMIAAGLDGIDRKLDPPLSADTPYETKADLLPKSLREAVFALGGEDDLVRLLARVTALQGFVETDEGANLLAGYKRAANILKKEEGSWALDQGGTGDAPPQETALVAALDQAEPRASEAIAAENITGAMTALASLRAPIDAFFDHVTVNAEDPGVRGRRLNLLARFRDAVDRVADFTKIEG